MSTPEPQKKMMDIGALAKYAAIVLTAIVLIYLAVRVGQLNSEVRLAQSDAEKQTAQVKAEMEAAVGEANKRGASRSAAALAAMLNPLIYQHKEGSTTIQEACDKLARSGEFELILVGDANGKVIATSDRKYDGQTIADLNIQEPAFVPEGKGWVSTYPIYHGSTRMGVVRIIVR